ncbi:uncharacterized protein LOC128858908 [Anastrepha ludens]|uniref:uncharacterized protein LOC128858908 n=1 Tax=Anastrepha ludens TaxID=28586 RepID=UPI0023AFBF11|nr:uncharacterized protein LOC128858908 [Anastrepha ludens]XP_053951454.1 uncharacterized protein LOC128858908 [Anastrepha ludens]XP_053951455.1 uncharacterized protein LOC128858908 [Anastrepha ludens]XP_053951456.1 uncharacterized protein LOC128858908 [Anastrepha ludens]XP_053951457.1 uncharacterized protein LOC128858908 [Anastrepha ludens]XP_053951458.1 uncharacterized protein LOC128858908 [Anastrepha ludens]
MMSERSSCQVLNAATNYIRAETLTPAAVKINDCKWQAGFYINRKQQEKYQQRLQRRQNECEYNQRKLSTRKQFHHSCCHQNNIQKATNAKMLQQEQRQLAYGKTMHELPYPKYYQTANNLTKAKNINSNPTTKTSIMTTVLDSSIPRHQQMQQDTNTNTTANCMNDTNLASPPPPPASQNVGGLSGGTQPSTIGVNLRVTGQCSQGGRKYMEDYFSVAYQQSENAKDLEYAFIGIYDGHGGAEAATFAKEHLMMQIINQKAFWSDSDNDVLRAIREGYIATHYAMWRDQENWPKTANGLLSTAGTTATVAFIRREKIYIGHVGDSGIVLGYQNENEKFWRAKQLTVDHKPESAEERARIQRSGGKVVVKTGVPRVVWNRPRSAGHRGPIRPNTPIDEVPFLAVARSLGDLWSYNSMRNVFVVSPDPDVQVIKINPKTFRCLIFGTDGLWNVVTPQEAVETVYERECINERLQAYAHIDSSNIEWTNPSKGLVERALKTWASKRMRADNTSVVTVILYPPGNETANANSIGANALPYNNLPNGACGLEYAEVSAEVPATDCGITYEEIAEKHAMPEAFRDFDYFLEEEALNTSLQSLNADNSGPKYCNDELSYYHNWSWEERQSECVGDYNHHTATLTAHSDVSICSKAISGDDGITSNTSNHFIANEADENAVDGVHNGEVSDDTKKKSNDLNYTHYSADTSSNSNMSSDVSNELGNAGFMTFAESYNSFLNEQMSHDSSSSSNSNSNCQIISGTNEILQEQQRYQQECMSEEEGYSLTKLETRREQQRCSGGVQTFKIFQTHGISGTSYVPQRQPYENNRKQEQAEVQRQHVVGQSTPTPQLFLEETRELEEALTWETECSTLSTTMNRFLNYPPDPQKPLELNSLLQQEREEEQQVAYERLEMQRKLAHPVVVEELLENGSNNKLEAVQPLMHPAPIDDAEDVLIEEYIEDETESAESQQMQDNTAQKDARVQINEVSSSISDQTECDSNSVKSLVAPLKQTSKVIEKIEKIEIMPQKIESTKLERLVRHPLMPHKSSPLSHYKKTKGSAAMSTSVSASTSASSAPTTTSVTKKVEVASFDFTSRPPKACPGRTSLKRSQTQFPNIPNENARFSETTSSHELSKRRRYNEYVLGAVSSTSNNNDNNSTNNASSSDNNNCRNRRCNRTSSPGLHRNSSCAAIALEKRQLRSNSGTVDYSKRTLRTRNSLSKDLKAKAALTTTMRRVTTQFLHDTAVSLMNSRTALAQQRQRRSSDVNHAGSLTLSRNSSVTSNSCSGNSVGRRARAEKLLAASTDNLEAAFSHVINLRSRKVAHFAVAAAAAAAAASHTQPTRRSKGSVVGVAGGGSPLISSSAMVLRRERHNLRSLSTRNAASASLMSSNGQREFSYGKATRSGGGGGLHAAGICPYGLASNATPTSKLLNGAAGVTVATRPRAHTLLMAKPTPGGGGGVATGSMGVRGGNGATPMTQPTSYGKRTTALRSGANSACATSMMLTRSGRNGRRLNR